MESPPEWYTVMTEKLESHLVSRGRANWEDLRQEVALRLFRTYGRASVDQRVIVTAIKNAAADLYRKEKRQVPTAGLQSDPPEDNKLANSPVTSECSDEVLVSLSELPSSMRSLLEMHLMHDLSYREISERLGISISTVKRHVRRARQRLRQIHIPRSLA